MWLSGWSYRKKVTLSRASGAVTNYQMKLLVGESSGATGENVDCGGKVSADFKDLRFTTSDGSTLLDYWIESVSGTTPNCLATVWIEFDSIGTGNTTFYMYYGNSGASDASNGTNTFIFFDDFVRADSTNTGWTEDTIDWSIASNTLTGTRAGTDGAIYKATATIPTSFAATARLKTGGANGYFFFYVFGSADNQCGLMMFGNLSKIQGRDGASSVDTGVSYATNTYYQLESRYNADDGKLDYAVDGTVYLTNKASLTTTAKNRVQFSIFNNNVSGTVDWCFVRKWEASEPAWGVLGIAESGDGGLFTFHG